MAKRQTEHHRWPPWAEALLQARTGDAGDVHIGGVTYRWVEGVLAAEALLTSRQTATKDSFSYIWSDRDRFEGPEAQARLRDWYRTNYGDVAAADWWADYNAPPTVLEVGCGKGLSGSLTFGDRLSSLRYLGVDVSDAVYGAADRFRSLGADAAFLHASLTDLPLRDAVFDLIYAQGVLHHTDSTEASLRALVPKLKPGGRFMFYVYRQKGPIREFTDDHIRERLADRPEQQKWDDLMPLTRLGEALGRLDLTVDIPEDIELLDIPAGPISVQRLIYWYVFKAFYGPDLSLEEMNHINLDWYAPANAHRHTVEEVRRWCAATDMTIEREHVQSAGISIIARRNG